MKSKGYNFKQHSLDTTGDLTIRNHKPEITKLQRPESDHDKHAKELQNNLINLNDSDKKFASSLLDAHKQYGKFTDKQHNWVKILKDKK